jgi:hypothetical protein
MIPIWEQPPIIAHTQRLLNSFQQWFGYSLLAESASSVIAEQLFLAPFAVLSHGTEPDPILNYGNQTALQLWEMDWDMFTQMPSRLTAEVDLREERSHLLALVAQQGYLTNFSGVRISKTGQRFLIEKAIIWKLFDEEGNVYGQAATFEAFKRLP